MTLQLGPVAVLSQSSPCRRGPGLPPFPYLREVHAEGVHVQPIQKASEALTEARKALVHQLEVHHVRLEVSHGI